MATKAAHTAFNREVSKYLESIGADFQLTNSIDGKGVINTVAGELSVSVHEPSRNEVFSIYCKFKDIQKAKQFIWLNVFDWQKLNTYSGKWNFHSYDAKELLEEFKEQIAPLLWESIDINDPDFDPTIRDIN